MILWIKLISINRTFIKLKSKVMNNPMDFIQMETVVEVNIPQNYVGPEEPSNAKLYITLFSEESQFRNESEVTKEAKGSYLKGDIRVSELLADYDGVVDLEMDFISESKDSRNEFNIHPNHVYIEGKQNKHFKRLVFL